jgi:hypothetical protein
VAPTAPRLTPPSRVAARAGTTVLGEWSSSKYDTVVDSALEENTSYQLHAQLELGSQKRVLDVGPAPAALTSPARGRPAG